MAKWYNRGDGSCWLTEQNAYDFGWINPSTPCKDWEFPHLIDANAYTCGQIDRQNQQPRNSSYRRDDYDDGFERRPIPCVTP